MSKRKYTCAACNAQTESVTSFPSDKEQREKWLEKFHLVEEKITKNSKVCRSHFVASDFMLKKPTKEAVPSQNLPVGFIFINFVNFIHLLGVLTSSG